VEEMLEIIKDLAFDGKMSLIIYAMLSDVNSHYLYLTARGSGKQFRQGHSCQHLQLCSSVGRRCQLITCSTS